MTPNPSLTKFWHKGIVLLLPLILALAGLDALVGNTGSSRLYLNNGQGTFTDSGLNLGSADTQAVLLDDLDGDGDVDMYLGNGSYQPDTVWLNLNPSVFVAGPEGKTITFRDGLTTTIEIPAGVLSQLTTFTYTAVATHTLPAPHGRSFLRRAFTLETAGEADPFAGNGITIWVHYRDTALNQFWLYQYDNGWQEVTTVCGPSGQYDRRPAQRYLGATVCHLTEFALFGGTERVVYLPLLLK
jgi:hypothetical protein